MAREAFRAKKIKIDLDAHKNPQHTQRTYITLNRNTNTLRTRGVFMKRKALGAKKKTNIGSEAHKTPQHRRQT